MQESLLAFQNTEIRFYRCDRDRVFKAIGPSVFQPRKMHMVVKRGPHYLSVLDTTIKHFEHMLSKYFLRKPRASQAKALKDITYGINHATNKSHRFTPSEINSPLFDPLVRSRLRQPTLIPFDTFVKQQLRLQEKVHEAPKKDTTSENWRNWKVGEEVMVDFG